MPTNRRPPTDAEAKALASAVRLRVIRLCIDRARTNRELAEVLKLNPATMLHHVRTLVDTGFLVAEEARRGRRGAREVPYRSTGKSWRLDVGDSGQPSPGRAMLEAYQQEIAGIDLDRTYQVRLGMRLTDEQHAELTGRLQELFDEYFHRQTFDAEGRAYSLYVHLHPDTARDSTG
jgi:DNA-binding transcriptional ArsR family regulator